MAYQPTLVNQSAFLMGSARLFVASSSSATVYVEMGAMKDVKLTERFDSWVIRPDNCAKIIKGIKNQEVDVEGSLYELSFAKFARMRNGLDTYSTATFYFDTGGNMSFTPQNIVLVHTGATSSQTVTALIYYAAPVEGFTIPFPADDSLEPGMIPLKLTGTCMSTRTIGQQLMSIVDLRFGVSTAATLSTYST